MHAAKRYRERCKDALVKEQHIARLQAAGDLRLKTAERKASDAPILPLLMKAVTPVLADGRPWLGAGSGGLSGPAVRTIALKQVADVAAAVEIPVVGMGGVERGSDAATLLAAGATAVAVGTASFRDPLAAERIRAELEALQPVVGGGS